MNVLPNYPHGEMSEVPQAQFPTVKNIFNDLEKLPGDNKVVENLQEITGWKGEWGQLSSPGDDHHNRRIFFVYVPEGNELRVVKMSATQDEYLRAEVSAMQAMYLEDVGWNEEQHVNDGTYANILGNYSAYLDAWRDGVRAIVGTKYAMPVKEAVDLIRRIKGDGEAEGYALKILYQVTDVMYQLSVKKNDRAQTTGIWPLDWGGSVHFSDRATLVDSQGSDLFVKGIGIDVVDLENPKVLAYDLDIPVMSPDYKTRLQYGRTLIQVSQEMGRGIGEGKEAELLNKFMAQMENNELGEVFMTLRHLYRNYGELIGDGHEPSPKDEGR